MHRFLRVESVGFEPSPLQSRKTRVLYQVSDSVQTSPFGTRPECRFQPGTSNADKPNILPGLDALKARGLIVVVEQKVFQLLHVRVGVVAVPVSGMPERKDKSSIFRHGTTTASSSTVQLQLEPMSGFSG